MAAEVSSMMQVLTGYKKEGDCESKVGGSAGGLVTRDLLGGCSTMTGNRELNLVSKVTTGSEKQLDFMLAGGEVFFPSGTGSFNDLNLPPPNLELKLFPQTPSFSSSSSHPDYTNTSVCTLDKVKSALRRATVNKNQRQSSDLPTSPTSSSVDDEPKSSVEDMEGATAAAAALVAAGCPACLSYVLVTKENPTCPRCSSEVPTHSAAKKAKIEIDLNSVGSSPGNPTSTPMSLFNDVIDKKDNS